MKSFNPSQVQFTLNTFMKLDTPDFSFNPSQVQFTLPAPKGSRQGVSKFQSLTGSIHTTVKIANANWKSTVSIPHRFNSHRDWKWRKRRFKRVSIPHRFNSHQIRRHTVSVIIIVSIPHRFNSHQLSGFCMRGLCSVSIPHRFNSHQGQIF